MHRVDKVACSCTKALKRVSVLSAIGLSVLTWYLTCSFGLGLLLLVHAVKQVAAATNFTQCLNSLVDNASATNDLTGLLNSVGQPVTNATDATAISYSLCVSACGSANESLQWSEFSQEFSAWLLPFLALISQLPFGAQYRLDNFMSALLTVGSPALAGYSLVITILNARWINRRFKQSVNYPNANYAVSILSRFQQVPLRLHFGLPDFHSLIILPENDPWWKCFAEFVNYTHSTWSIASATSIAWVVLAYILAVINSLSDVYANAQSNGEATGSLWLWLVPIVIGWLQLSPKCDFYRLQEAYERAERHGRHAIAAAHKGDIPAVTQKALTITAAEEDVMSPDELLTPPIFNYSRSLPWSSTVETTFLMYKMATLKARSGIPVRIGVDWVKSEHKGDIHPMNRLGSAEEIAKYCSFHDEIESHWAPGIFTRMAIASCAALSLQWGTVGAAVIVAYFTPTTVSYSTSRAISSRGWLT